MMNAHLLNLRKEANCLLYIWGWGEKKEKGKEETLDDWRCDGT